MGRGQGLAVHDHRGALHADAMRATGVFAETFSRVNPLTNVTVLTSQTLHMTAVYLTAGTVVTSISYVSGTTALNTGVNQWAALYDKDRGRLAVTADRTNTAWGGNAVKTFTIASPYTVLTSDRYYLALLINATTAPTLGCANGGNIGAAIYGLVPILVGTSDAALTDPASAPVTATAITPTASIPYAYVT